MMRQNTRKRNTPIATLIRNYVDKKSGKIKASREEIQWRFDCLDWKDQKKILAAFLRSGMSDRDWAYAKLLDYWDEAFIPQIRELWEAYHEYKCSWVVIRHFPLDYIVQHQAEFTDERDYYFICLRLAKNHDYAIDRSRLSANDYLAVLHHTGRRISDDEAHDTLFTIIHDCCFTSSAFPRLEHVGEGNHPDVVTPAYYHEVRLCIYYLLKLGKEDVVRQFEQWNEKVEDTIYESPEFKSINRSEFFLSYEYESRLVELSNIYAYQMLGEEYKKAGDPSVEEMRKAFNEGLDWYERQKKSTSVDWDSDVNDTCNLDDNAESPLPF